MRALALDRVRSRRLRPGKGPAASPPARGATPSFRRRLERAAPQLA